MLTTLTILAIVAGPYLAIGTLYWTNVTAWDKSHGYFNPVAEAVRRGDRKAIFVVICFVIGWPAFLIVARFAR